MKVSYDKEVDALYIELSEKKPEAVVEIEEGMNIDVASDGTIVGMELIDASNRIPLDSFLKYEIDGESIDLMAMGKRERIDLSLSPE
jgi:uncharacterized protein YuzE